MKDLMQITALVPTKKVREVSLWLEDNGAVSMMVKAYRNGEAPAEKKKANGNGHARGGSNIEKGERMQQWLKQHVKGTFNTQDIIDKWEAAGFRREAIYGALTLAATRNKLLKKLGPGRFSVR